LAAGEKLKAKQPEEGNMISIEPFRKRRIGTKIRRE
jgi:hypothetical protein